jgi:hypothetical protein
MDQFKSPLTDNDIAIMRDVSARCDQRAPFIQALSDLGIDIKELDVQNRAQKQFCDRCCQLRAEGVL